MDLLWTELRAEQLPVRSVGTPHGTTLFKFRATSIVAKQFPYIHDSLQP